MFNTLYKKCLGLAAHKSSKYYLAVVSFTESSFFPIPPDVMVIPMVISKKDDFFKVFLIATIFSVLGGVLGYLIGAFFFDIGMQVMTFYGYEEKLISLKNNLALFEGCSLKKTATNLVFGQGQENADVMLIGEAPGRHEDRQGVPFIGPSGQLLDEMLSYIGLSREKNIYLTNIIPWRPPGNRQPTDIEIISCLPFLYQHIALVKPRILVFLGATSAKTLLESTEGITKLRGKWYDYKSSYLKKSGIESIPAMATLHPAYLLRQPAQKRSTWKDLLSIRELLNTYTG